MKKTVGLASTRRWSISRLGLVAVSITIAAVVVLNLETVFPSEVSEAEAARGLHHLHHRGRFGQVAVLRDLNWPTSTYFHRSRPVHRRSSKAPRLPGKLVDEELFHCDRSHPRTDVCHMKGDVRLEPSSASFVLYARNASTPLGVEKIKPYTRKWEKSCMDIVHEVTLRSVAAAEDENERASCDVRHTVPAVVFTTGGYTGNLYHEFHDGLIPLYITSQHLRRRLVLVAVEFHSWWLMKYGDVVEQLSDFPVLDFDTDNRTHCFPEVTIGVHIHDELTIEPSLMPHNESIRDFRRLLDAAYSPPPPPGEEEEALVAAGSSSSGGASSISRSKRRRPRLVVVLRNETRVILNLEVVVSVAEEVGFEVRLFTPGRSSELRKVYWALNSSEALLGVHGAAMTHFLFMRPGSVFVQVVPLGTSWAADAYYGLPARRLGLRYHRYEVTPAESSLSDKYAPNDTVMVNPELVNERGGWQALKSIYLEGQDVRLSPGRLKLHLRAAYADALAFMQQRHTRSA